MIISKKKKKLFLLLIPFIAASCCENCYPEVKLPKVYIDQTQTDIHIYTIPVEIEKCKK